MSTIIEDPSSNSRPAPKVGRVYKALCHGMYAYNVWSGESSSDDHFPSQADVEDFETFVEWSSVILRIEEARKLTRDLNQAEAIRPKTIEDKIRVAKYGLEEAKSRVKAAEALLDDLTNQATYDSEQ